MVINFLKSFLCIQQRCGASSQSMPQYHWDVNSYINQNILYPNKNYAVMVLNRPLTQDKEFMKSLWNNAFVRILVDGGAVRWDKYLSKLPQNFRKTMKPPELLLGDFDSITDDVMQKYQMDKGCKIVHTPDQNYTDFTKAIVVLEKYCQDKMTELDNVIALAQSSGRIDQILGNIQTLFLARDKCLLNPKTKLFLLKDDVLSWLLSPGVHEIRIPTEIANKKGLLCSLIPLGGTCESVTTKGLKWNLDDSTLKFGELVSTSNSIEPNTETVKVECSHTIFWSMRIPNLMNP